MDIRSYLKAQKKTLSSLAGELECSVTTLHGYVSGRRPVPLRVVVKVEQLSDGAVCASDWLPESSKGIEVAA